MTNMTTYRAEGPQSRDTTSRKYNEAMGLLLAKTYADMRPRQRRRVARRSEATEPRSGRKRPRNKNVSELVFFQQANGIAAHYEYAPFGAVIATSKSTPVTAYDFREYNPFRFSSEYNDNLLGLAYYNYRHYCPLEGRFLAFDMFYELHILKSYLSSCNDGINYYDSLGNLPRVQGKNSTWPTIAPNPNDYSCAKEMPTIYGEVPSGSCCQYSERVVYANNVVEFTADGSGGYFRKGELCVSGAKCKYIKVRQCLGDRAYVERTLLIQQINGIWRKSDM